MKESYVTTGFRKAIVQRSPARAAALQSAFNRRLDALLDENVGASKEKMFHLEVQILPGIAAYETLQTIMPKEEAVQIIHDIIEQHSREIRKTLDKLMLIPGLYRLVPNLSGSITRKVFNEAAGFASVEYETSSRCWRIDMTKCPYNDACVHYGCPELCRCFCDSDDVSYDNLHPKLLWHRTKTLGRGNDCCNFCLKIR